MNGEAQERADMKTEQELVSKVKSTRTAWLESHGVPISAEFARFAEAIGELLQFVEAGRASVSPSVTVSESPDYKICTNQNGHPQNCHCRCLERIEQLKRASVSPATHVRSERCTPDCEQCLGMDKASWGAQETAQRILGPAYTAVELLAVTSAVESYGVELLRKRASVSPAPAPQQVGPYSCVCGFGMSEPCEHWKKAIAAAKNWVDCCPELDTPHDCPIAHQAPVATEPATPDLDIDGDAIVAERGQPSTEWLERTTESEREWARKLGTEIIDACGTDVNQTQREGQIDYATDLILARLPRGKASTKEVTAVVTGAKELADRIATIVHGVGSESSWKDQTDTLARVIDESMEARVKPLVQTLEVLSAITPRTSRCSSICSCVGCIARRALVQFREGSK